MPSPRPRAPGLRWPRAVHVFLAALATALALAATPPAPVHAQGFGARLKAIAKEKAEARARAEAEKVMTRAAQPKAAAADSAPAAAAPAAAATAPVPAGRLQAAAEPTAQKAGTGDQQSARVGGGRIPDLGGFVGAGAPITTTLADARWAIDSLDNFTPREGSRSVAELQRTPNGGFVLQPGYWALHAQSYGVRAGATPPYLGVGHILAFVNGPASDAVTTILRNSVNHPEISQGDIQMLLWAIAGRAVFENLTPQMKATGARLLTPRQLAALNRSALDAPAQAGDASTVQGQVQQQLLHVLSNPSAVTYQGLEQIVSPGTSALSPGPGATGSRAPIRGRWSMHPDGYYVRFLPRSYGYTLVHVWVPQGSPAVGKELDPATFAATPGNESSQLLVMSGRLQPTPTGDVLPPAGPTGGYSGGGYTPAPPPVPTAPYVPPPTPPPPPPPAATTGGPVIDGRFHPLTAVDVRMDSGGGARDGKLRFYLTLKNATKVPQRVDIGSFSAIMSDLDGLGAPTATLYRPDVEPLEPYRSSPTLVPGGQLPAMLVLEPFAEGAPVQRLTIRENNGRPAQFDLSRIVVAGQATTGPVTTFGATTEFKSFGSAFDARFDGIQVARNANVYEAFFTFRNVSNKVQQVPLGGFKLLLANASGVAAGDVGALYPARGMHDVNSSIRLSPRVEPGAEARVRYWFRDNPGGKPTQISITNGSNTLTFPLP